VRRPREADLAVRVPDKTAPAATTATVAPRRRGEAEEQQQRAEPSVQDDQQAFAPPASAEPMQAGRTASPGASKKTGMSMW
jgi:hypothetical protein